MLKLIPKKQAGGITTGFNSAKDWTQSYINSPMYKQRLMRMNNTEKLISGEFPGGAQSNPVNKQIQQRSISVAGITPQVVSEIPGDRSGERTLAAYDTLGGGQTLRVRQDVASTPAATATMAHELSHGSLNGGQPYSQSFDYKYVSPMLVKPGGGKFTSTYSPYIQSPTEMKARLDSIRFQMQKKGIHDARTQEFTPEQLKRLQADKEITESQDYKDLSSQLPGNKKNAGMMWLFNNIARSKTSNNGVVYAQAGTKLATKNPVKKWMINYMDSDVYKKRLVNMDNSPITKEKRQGLLNTNIVLSDKVGDTRYMENPGFELSSDGLERLVTGKDRHHQNYMKEGVADVLIHPNVEEQVNSTYGLWDKSLTGYKIGLDDILAHELSHGQRTLNSKEERLMKSLATKGRLRSAHDDMPGEQKADLDAVRYMMFKKGVYDTSKGNMNMDDFNRALSDKDISKSFLFQRLMKSFTPENIIKLNNTIASNTSKKYDNNRS